MTKVSTTAFALLTMLGSIAFAAPAQAAAGIVMLSIDSFSERCTEQGGAFGASGNGYSCELGTTQIDCVFAGIEGHCEWDGGPNKREVIRVIGMAAAESLSEANASAGASGMLCYPGGPPCVIIPCPGGPDDPC